MVHIKKKNKKTKKIASKTITNTLWNFTKTAKIDLKKHIHRNWGTCGIISKDLNSYHWSKRERGTGWEEFTEILRENFPFDKRHKPIGKNPQKIPCQATSG